MDLSRFRVPLGPLVADLGVVGIMVFSAGQLVSRLELMDRRVAILEARASSDRISERTAMLEQRAAVYDRDRAEILDALHRIEAKLDGKADKQ